MEMQPGDFLLPHGVEFLWKRLMFPASRQPRSSEVVTVSLSGLRDWS